MIKTDITLHSTKSASVLTEEDVATLFKILGVEDPGPTVTTMTVHIDWRQRKVPEVTTEATTAD